MMRAVILSVVVLIGELNHDVLNAKVAKITPTRK
jgi:hypothetical protein